MHTPRASASANAGSPLQLPHTIVRISRRRYLPTPGRPRAANGATSASRRALILRGGRAAPTAMGGLRRVLAQSVAVAARGGVEVVEACDGVNQAHAVGGWWIREGARAWEADGSRD